jgi:hypothetical protein
MGSIEREQDMGLADLAVAIDKPGWECGDKFDPAYRISHGKQYQAGLYTGLC